MLEHRIGEAELERESLAAEAIVLTDLVSARTDERDAAVEQQRSAEESRAQLGRELAAEASAHDQARERLAQARRMALDLAATVDPASSTTVALPAAANGARDDAVLDRLTTVEHRLAEREGHLERIVHDVERAGRKHRKGRLRREDLDRARDEAAQLLDGAERDLADLRAVLDARAEHGHQG